jgi:Ubiquitin-specific protease C-terminal
LRLHTPSSGSFGPKHPIKRQANITLQEMIGHNQAVPITLFYEIDEHSIIELETKQYVNFIWLDASLKEHQQRLLVLKQSTFGQIVDALREKLNFPERAYRVFEVQQHRIRQFLDLNALLTSSHPDIATLYIEVS